LCRTIETSLDRTKIGVRRTPPEHNAIAFAEIAQCRPGRVGDTLERWTHFGPRVEDQNHVQRFLLVPEIYDGLRLSSETLYDLAVQANFSIHMDRRNVAAEGGLTLRE
jgi:hypothetical protein